MYITCGKCFESDCNHWKHLSDISEKEVVEKSFFTGNSSTKIVETLHNYLICQCGFRKEVQEIDFGKLKCKCGNQIFYSKSNIELYQVRHDLGYYIRSKCPTCKSNGKVTKNLFKRCTECDGTGGIICIECNGTFIGTPGLNNYSFKCDKCNHGYTDRCYACCGRRATVSGTVKIDCTDCTEFV